MAPDGDVDLKLEIAHILTMDVVAYSTLLINEQSRLMTTLVQTVRATARFQRAEADGKLVRLPTGDGMALVFFDDAEGPLECAKQLAESLRAHPEIRIRMGIHSGPVNSIRDVNDHSNLAGAGLDMAQRVMNCGDAGHILLSKRVADDLLPHPRWARSLHDLGEYEVKHLRRISLFNFYSDSLGNAATPTKLRGTASRSTAASSLGKRVVIIASVLGILLCLGVSYFLLHRLPDRPALAVLPFADLSQRKDQEYLSDGITEQITNSLAKTPGLFVVGRTSAFAFKGQNPDVREVGRRLHVSHVLEGSVSRHDNRLQIDAELVNTSNGFQVWSKSYDSEEKDILNAQNVVAQKVAGALRAQLHLPASEEIAKQPTYNAEAYDLYLRGRYFLNKRTIDSIKKGRGLFEQAVSRDARFALGHAGIADAYTLLGEYGDISNTDALRLAWPEVSSALALDNKLAEGYVSRGILLGDFDWNWEEAEKSYRRAIELNPNSAAARHWYSTDLAELGRFDEALAQISLAQKQDPLAPIILAAKAKILYVARRYKDAINQGQAVLDLEANFAPALYVLAQAYASVGRFDEAIAAAKKYGELSGDVDTNLVLAYVYATAGRNREATAIVRKATTPSVEFSSYEMATVCAASHDTPAALGWLQKAITDRSLLAVWTKVDPRLDNIRSHPKYKELVAQLVTRSPSPP